MPHDAAFLVTCGADGIWRAVSPDGVDRYSGDLSGLAEHLDFSRRRQLTQISVDEFLTRIAASGPHGSDAALMMMSFCGISYAEAVGHVRTAGLWEASSSDRARDLRARG